MSKHKTRNDKTCLNCGFFVEENFCPRCGQNNTESRHPFHHLFTHFISDFFHYDSAFWRTTRLLFLSPGKLSLEYMNGKRKSQVNPFSLYIFISFLTFFIPIILTYPGNNADKVAVNTEKTGTNIKADSIVTIETEVAKKEIDIIMNQVSRSFEKDKDFINSTIFQILKKAEEKDRTQKAFEFFINNLPKVLFAYMPIFAFWMWLLHNKKKRYYFDSGIFTLHFFSVVLLSITLCIVSDWIFAWLAWDTARVLLWNVLLLYITFYFFRGNRVFYGQSRLVSNIKALLLMFVNTSLISIILVLYAAFTVYKIYLE